MHLISSPHERGYRKKKKSNLQTLSLFISRETYIYIWGQAWNWHSEPQYEVSTMAIWFSRERLWGLCVSWLLAEPGGSDQISTARTNPRTLRYQGSIVQGNKTPGSPLTLNFLKQAWEDRVRQWGTNIFPIPWCMKSKKGKLQVKGVLRENPFQLAFHTCHSPSKELLQLGKASKLMGGFLTVHVRFNERGHVSIYHTEQKAEHSISILWGLIYGAFKITLILQERVRGAPEIEGFQ